MCVVAAKHGQTKRGRPRSTYIQSHFAWGHRVRHYWRIELRRECYTKVTGEEESMLSELVLDQTNLFRYAYKLCEESLLE